MGTARVAAAVEEDGRLDARARDRALRGPHDYEVYHAFELNLPTYPGEEQVAALAGGGCLDEFAGFVGVPYDRSVLEP